MTALCTESDIWTTEYLVDQTFCNLAVYPSYYEQARELLYRIPRGGNAAPAFQIRIQDLWNRVIVELEKCKPSARKYVLLKAAGRVFENIDYFYFHNSIMRNLQVELVE
ncbi:MAG: hypothetical protein ABI361_02125 [Nitrososphaera sp.]|jgi:hypothetical protein